MDRKSIDCTGFAAWLLDIEGTVTSISFVKDVLFPHSLATLPAHLDAKWDTPELMQDLEALSEFSKLEAAKGGAHLTPFLLTDPKEKIIEAVVQNVNTWVSLDCKATPLKQLQGHIWRDAYASGDIKGHFYEDVLPVLQQVHESGRKIYIYSSGSVEAQKMLFSHSVFGDITSLVSGHFDTTTGPKTDAASYAKIAEHIHCTPDKVLFLTDIEKEARAARAAGMTSVLVRRPGNAPLSKEATDDFDVIDSLHDLRA